jgi:hypothetical protein
VLLTVHRLVEAAYVTEMAFHLQFKRFRQTVETAGQVFDPVICRLLVFFAMVAYFDVEMPKM